MSGVSDLDRAICAPMRALGAVLADARAEAWEELAYIKRPAWRYLRMQRMAGYL